MTNKRANQRKGSLINERIFIEDAIAEHGPREDLLEELNEINEALYNLRNEAREEDHEETI